MVTLTFSGFAAVFTGVDPSFPHADNVTKNAPPISQSSNGRTNRKIGCNM
jgi:hypothetical protein